MPSLVRLLVLGIFVIVLTCFLLPLLTLLVRNTGHLVLDEPYALVPAPWLVAKTEGGTALRLAMVHDVLHERYWRHGPAWYEARQQRAEAAVAAWEGTKTDPDQALFDRFDDLAVGCDRVGRPLDGIAIARRKLALQLPEPTLEKAPPELRYYTGYANLGTLLIHANLAQALAGDSAALVATREGLGWIRLAMRAYPDAHFGRETWQAQAVDFLLAAQADPALLETSDVIWNGWIRGRPFDSRWAPGAYGRAVEAAWLGRERGLGADHGGDVPGGSSEPLRSLIPECPVKSSQPGPTLGRHGGVPFDEPTLGIIGMWTLGAGANPHFALALAHLMEGVGQRHLAWEGYERAVELGDRLWPVAEIRERIISECRNRQHAIEVRLGEDPAHLRQAHRAELAFGQSEQRAYQDYERDQLAAGMDPAAPDFYAGFFRTHRALATAPGNEDTVLYEPSSPWWAWLPFAIGLGCTLVLFTLAMVAHQRMLKAQKPRGR